MLRLRFRNFVGVLALTRPRSRVVALFRAFYRRAYFTVGLHRFVDPLFGVFYLLGFLRHLGLLFSQHSLHSWSLVSGSVPIQVFQYGLSGFIVVIGYFVCVLYLGYGEAWLVSCLTTSFEATVYGVRRVVTLLVLFYFFVGVASVRRRPYIASALPIGRVYYYHYFSMFSVFRGFRRLFYLWLVFVLVRYARLVIVRVLILI